MLSSSTVKRTVIAAILAGAVGATGAATANAATITKTDDTAADFALGTQNNTVVRTLTGADGAVELARTFEESFAGTTLPAGWTSTPWPLPPDPPGAGTSTVSGGALIVDGALADSHVTAGPGSSLTFRATLGGQPFTHVGFGTNFNGAPWAMFSTGIDGAGKLYARTNDGVAPAIDFLVPGVDAALPHDYRIDWTATGFDYFVDGAPVATQAIPMAGPLNVLASNYEALGGSLSVESIALGAHKTPGTFTSRPLDATDARVTAATLTATADVPAGTAASYETRTADDAAGLDAATWTALGAGGAVATPKRFVQYRAQMSAANAALTPRLDKVAIDFTVDDQAPTVTIDPVAVSGTTAKVTFSSDDAAATVKCKLDGGAFAPCSSPATFAGLAAGAHTIAVQATDTHGNTGSATRAFDVAAPPSGGGGTTPPAGGGGTTPPTGGGNTPPAGDTSQPNVLVLGRSVRVSSRGVAKLRIRCPRSEISCAISAKLKQGGKRIARKSLMIPGGSTRTLRFQLSSSARAKLADRGSIKAKAVITATDAAGNVKTTTRRITLKAAAV